MTHFIPNIALTVRWHAVLAAPVSAMMRLAHRFAEKICPIAL